jgi:hypothetical protein
MAGLIGEGQRQDCKQIRHRFKWKNGINQIKTMGY